MKHLGKVALLGLTVLLATGFATSTVAQEEEERVLEIGKFYPFLEGGLQITQSSYSDNWAGGDRGSIVWTAILNANAENQLSEKVNWLNTLKLAFGQTHQQSLVDGERVWDKPEKSTDLIDLETVFRFTLGAWLDPYASGRFESQFQDASDPFGRNLSLNPLKFREAVGVSRVFIDKKDEKLLSRAGFALRQTSRKIFVEAPPSDLTASESANDGGLEWITDYTNKILEDRVTWTSRLSLYQPFFYSGSDEFEALTAQQLLDAGLDSDIVDYTKALDIDWENIFSTQITKIISVQLYTRFVYDKYDNSVFPALKDNGDLKDPVTVKNAVRKAGQFKQTLAIGLTYRFL
ncbi:MAG: DUF3078 domain-containing protein [Candidatus Eisenbacteria bacterium]|uniref:DUF3078 domain-containing protein n=1 Tax=Eiseniibacteriota bacterium TaxID=2212470 RepID=A0A7Y2EG15_UNCEI|nr:DUF3078 domain-containing protein [Candidatus Eisenbacteria bacterium]